jgi:hypothetical protein
MWIELFALFNLAGLAPDIFLAHSINSFRAPAEYVPLIFSLVAPLLLIPAIWSLAQSRLQPWRGLGHFVGWTSVVIGVTGLILHLQSQFFQQWTLASLVYAAPFAAPLAYTGIGLLLIMPLIAQVGRMYLRVCAMVMVVQMVVGIAGFVLHVDADLHAVGPTLFERVIHGAPVFAPLLFPNLALLAGIGMWVLYQKLPVTESAGNET